MKWSDVIFEFPKSERRNIKKTLTFSPTKILKLKIQMLTPSRCIVMIPVMLLCFKVIP